MPEGKKGSAHQVWLMDDQVRHLKEKYGGVSPGIRLLVFADMGEPASEGGTAFRAAKKAILCGRCQRVGQSLGCAKCAELRKGKR